jgi:hypothetical protein
MKIIFNVRAFGHGKTEITKNLHHFFPHLGNGMNRAAEFTTRRQGHVNLFRGQTLFELGLLQYGLPRSNRFRHFILQHIKRRTRRLALLRPHGAQRFHLLGNGTLLAKRCNA